MENTIGNYGGLTAPSSRKETQIEQDDKQCWEEMRIVKKVNWNKKDSVSLAIYAAELVIDNFEIRYPNDKRPREAIEAAKRWLKNPTEKNRSAAASMANAAVNAVNVVANAAAYAAGLMRLIWWLMRRLMRRLIRLIWILW